MVHITGGGFHENIPRGIPDGLGVVLEKGSWPVPPIFDFLRSRGDLSDADMQNTFNCGLGMIVVVPPDLAEAAARATGGTLVGHVIEGEGVVVQ